ncbi:MAG: thiamine phosphate synthase [Candidatus Altiarchaeota archaeon]|nr:thiamine phosphate synthase [Candidatus Altiarchaeota archaeon]
MKLHGFYFITDSGLSTKPDVEAVTDAVAAGAKIVQYRDKTLPKKEMIEYAKRMCAICKGKAIFLVNDDVEVAYESGADGVHLGQDDMSPLEARAILGRDKIIGWTVHNVGEAILARDMGVDYIGASPIFSTTTKKDAGEPAGIKLIKEIKKAVDLPVAAIGGVNETNVDEVISAGADMACAISATVAKKDITGAVRYFVEKFRR